MTAPTEWWQRPPSMMTRVVGFDNARGKGDHCHIGGVEQTYAFVSVEQLIEDFIAAVDAARGKT